MFKSTLLSIKVAVLATAILLTAAGESQAQRFGGRGWGGGWGRGGWGGGWGGYGYRGYGYGGYGWGRPVYYGGYLGSPYYATYGSYGYSSPYYVYGSAPYYYNDTYFPYDTYAAVTPVTSYQSYYPSQGIPSQGIQPAVNANMAMVEVNLPSNAKLTFDDTATMQTGSKRLFSTPELTPGKTYSYEVRATWPGSDGKEVMRTQKVEVEAGKRAVVNFSE
jgi:uncharacterized protein (TIGR03000 family)